METEYCEGDGDCFILIDDIKEEFGKDPNVICKHNCTLKECPNFPMCRNRRPFYILDSHDGFCPICAIVIGRKLETVESALCVGCQKTYNEAIQQPQCQHCLCSRCFKNIYFFYLSEIYESEEDEDQEKYENEKNILYLHRKRKLFMIYDNETERALKISMCPKCKKELPTPPWAEEEKRIKQNY